MGYGVPAGLGLQAATGERPVVLVGDGAFQMTGWELGNARRYWAATRSCWSSTTPAGRCCAPSRPRASFNDLDRWDFASMAAGMGGDGQAVVHTRAELGAALANAPGPRAGASS
jgi:indolepyruvate decarboxylase